jgi:beta-lactamase regulating signal transducer with metallopeptidase domain
VEACRKCVEKRKGTDIACDRYVQCMIGADEASEYVKSTMKLLKQIASVFNIGDVRK